MWKKVFLWLASVLLLGVFSGCGTAQAPKMLSEDIEILTVYAPEIKVLKNRSLRTNSKEKYEAALKLAQGVDFSLTRSVETLDQIFSAADALTTRSVEYGDEIAFYYNYQDHFVRFRFWRSKNVITESEVRIK
ncbi:MAG: hypothetical protein E7052_00640 [Lentisphaerae bacterium]|nr:hypothetical protein [Lentisphaerota bacterium]